VQKIFGYFVIIICILSIISCDIYSNRPIPFDKNTWNFWDVGTYDASRYNMAIWFFKNNWFEGKTREIILQELSANHPERDDGYYGYSRYSKRLKTAMDIPVTVLVYELRYSNNFFEKSDDQIYPIPIAYLRIYFNKNNIINKCEIIEGDKNMNIEAFEIKQYWEMK
jgi:hypothetical protein